MKKILSLMVTLCMLMMCIMVPMVASADGETNYALASNGTTISGVMTDDLPNVIDGNSSTAAWMRKASTNASITLTFENYVDLSRVNMLTNGKNYAYWQVEASYDGVTWFPLNYKGVTTGNNGLYFEPSADTDAVAKYLKIANIWEATFFIYEVEALGTEVTGFPYLKSLTSASGTWTTAFDKSSTSYNVQVASLENLPELTYETLMEDATVQYTEATASNNYTATIAVTHGGETATYTVQFVVYNYALASNGTTVSATWTSDSGNIIDGNAGTYGYFRAPNANVPESNIILTFSDFVQISTLKLRTNNARSNMYALQFSLNGEDWFEASLSASVPETSCLNYDASAAPLITKYVKIKNVSAANTMVYEFEVYGDSVSGIPYLKSLSSDNGDWVTAFAQGTADYTVQVDSLDNLPQLTYEVLMEDAEVAYVPASSENNYTATITVTHGTETFTYTVKFVVYNYALASNGTTVSATWTTDPGNIIDGNAGTYGYFRAPNSNVPESNIILTFDSFIQIDSCNLRANSQNSDNYGVLFSVNGTDWFEKNSSISIHETNCLTYDFSTTAPIAKYVKIINRSTSNFIVYELEVYGKKLTASDMPCISSKAVYDAETATATATVNLVNVGSDEANDKYYLFAVYVDDVFYGVDKIDKSATKIAAGNVGTPAVLNVKLPDGTDSSRVTGKLFVWSDSKTIVPVTTPFDVL